MRTSKIRLKKFVESMDEGCIIYINAINLSLSAIDLLKEYVKSGRLKPCRDEVEKLFAPSVVESVMNGTIISPHMNYFVKEV